MLHVQPLDGHIEPFVQDGLGAEERVGRRGDQDAIDLRAAKLLADEHAAQLDLLGDCRRVELLALAQGRFHRETNRAAEEESEKGAVVQR